MMVTSMAPVPASASLLTRRRPARRVFPTPTAIVTGADTSCQSLAHRPRRQDRAQGVVTLGTPVGHYYASGRPGQRPALARRLPRDRLDLRREVRELRRADRVDRQPGAIFRWSVGSASMVRAATLRSRAVMVRRSGPMASPTTPRARQICSTSSASARPSPGGALRSAASRSIGSLSTLSLLP